MTLSPDFCPWQARGVGWRGKHDWGACIDQQPDDKHVGRHQPLLPAPGILLCLFHLQNHSMILEVNEWILIEESQSWISKFMDSTQHYSGHGWGSESSSRVERCHASVFHLEGIAFQAIALSETAGVEGALCKRNEYCTFLKINIWKQKSENMPQTHKNSCVVHCGNSNWSPLYWSFHQHISLALRGRAKDSLRRNRPLCAGNNALMVNGLLPSHLHWYLSSRYPHNRVHPLTRLSPSPNSTPHAELSMVHLTTGCTTKFEA